MCSNYTDQLNTTVHGTMRKTPYELVFGQPPHTSIFPGIDSKEIMEEDIEDILTEELAEGGMESPAGEKEELSEEEKASPAGEEESAEGGEEESSEGGEEESPAGEKEPLATSSKHLELRNTADKLYRRNAERMQLKYAKGKRKKVLTFSRGDFVSLRIPRIDRSSTDAYRLPCVVVERLGSKFHLYRLRCSHGVLKQCFGEGDLELFKGDLDIPVDGWEESAIISLREASRKANPPNEFHAGLCNCKTNCSSNQCSC